MNNGGNMYRFITLLSLHLTLCAAPFQFIHQTHPYATHQPILYEIASHTEGPIIEFGCGDGSTDLLHQICKEKKRLLISLDDDRAWLEKVQKKYAHEDCEWHQFYFVPGKKDDLNPDHWVTFFNEHPFLKELIFDVCFVDQSPWLARYETIKRFKSHAKFVILHDCNYFPEQKIFGSIIEPLIRDKRIAGKFDFGDMFAYFKVYFPPHPWPANTGPPTLVASDCIDTFPEIVWEKYANQ